MSIFRDEEDGQSFRIVASRDHVLVVETDDDKVALAVAEDRFKKAGVSFAALEVVGSFEDGEDLDDLSQIGLPEGMVVGAAAELYSDEEVVVDDNAVMSGLNVQVWQYMEPASVLGLLARREVPSAKERRTPDMITSAEEGAIRRYLAERPLSDSAALDRINQLLVAAEGVWAALPREAQDRLHENSEAREEVSLRHCLRWGVQGAEEMVAMLSDEDRSTMKGP